MLDLVTTAWLAPKHYTLQLVEIRGDEPHQTTVPLAEGAKQRIPLVTFGGDSENGNGSPGYARILCTAKISQSRRLVVPEGVQQTQNKQVKLLLHWPCSEQWVFEELMRLCEEAEEPPELHLSHLALTRSGSVPTFEKPDQRDRPIYIAWIDTHSYRHAKRSFVGNVARKVRAFLGAS